MSACLPGVSEPVRVVEAAGARPVDRRELEHVPVRQGRGERLVRRLGEAADPLLDERSPHLREHLAGHARDDVDAEGRADAAGEQLAGRGRPVAHQHLDVRSDRRLAAGLRDPVELLVGQVGHVDVADVRAHQLEVVHVLHGVVVQVVEPHADVHADRDPELARERPVVLRDVEVRVAGLARRHREREQAVVGGEVGVADAADVLGVLELAERPPLAAGRHAVRVDGADARVLEALDSRVGVVGRVADVRPVEQRRDARVERLERAGVVADVDVLWAVVPADTAEHHREVVVERAGREDATDRRLPRVAVRVDEPRHDDHAARVDLLGIAYLETSADLDDHPVLDEHVAVRDLADVGVHRDHEAVANEQSLRAHVALLGWPVTDTTTAATAFSRRERVSRCRMYSEHKHVTATESTGLGVPFPWRRAGSRGPVPRSPRIVGRASPGGAFRHG